MLTYVIGLVFCFYADVTCSAKIFNFFDFLCVLEFGEAQPIPKQMFWKDWEP